MTLVRKLIVVVVALAGLLVLNALFEHGFGEFQINPYYARIINLIGINITLAVSLNLINGLAGQFSIGHAGFMAVGGYTATYLTVYHGEQMAGLVGMSPRDPMATWVLMLPSLLAGALAAAMAGLLVGVPSLRLKGDYLAIVTLGFSEIIRVIILNIPAVGGATGFTDAIPITNFFWIFAMAILTIVITRNIATSTFGRALFAIRSDEIAAEAMGINTTRYKVLAFVISAALAGVAGGLSGQLFANPLNPQNLNFVKSIEVVVMIVLGGIGSITGAVLGATTLTILPEALRTFDQQFPGLRMVIYALLLILLMIFRPQGLLGRRELSLAWLRRPQRTEAPAS
jgi:branched-chain amino acid transport system permease protein